MSVAAQGLVMCGICREAKSRLVYANCRDRRGRAVGRFEVRRCEACGVAFLWPRPAREVLEELYSRNYQSHSVSGAAPGQLFRTAKTLSLLPYRARFGVEGVLFPPFGQARLLDIGCGTGEYLAAMARCGWRSSGCDISDAALAQARLKLPYAQFYRGALEDLPFGPGSFEVVSLWHTLEHLPDPRNALERVYWLLVPGGRVIIATPNLDSVEAYLLGVRWAEIDIPGHLFFFSKASLHALVRETGFDVISVRPQVHPSSVSDAVDFLLDDLLGIARLRQRRLLYYALFPLTAMSYVLGNWGCIELIATKGGV